MSPAGLRRWKVAELAEAAGVLARTLHFYDEIGLLTPSDRTPAGARAYDEDDVARLYRIVALRRLGHPVKRIAGLLDDGGIGTLAATRSVLAERAAEPAEDAAREPLRELLNLLERRAEPSPEHYLAALEAMGGR